MLGKLLKHEWREIWKIPAILLGILLVVSVFAGSAFFAPVWDSELSGLGILAMLVWMLYYFAIIGVSIQLFMLRFSSGVTPMNNAAFCMPASFSAFTLEGDACTVMRS